MTASKTTSRFRSIAPNFMLETRGTSSRGRILLGHAAMKRMHFQHIKTLPMSHRNRLVADIARTGNDPKQDDIKSRHGKNHNWQYFGESVAHCSWHLGNGRMD